MKGVSSSLAATDKALKSTGGELSKINKQLKFDPTSTELLAQKHDILQKHLHTSKERVDQLSQMLEAHNKKMRDADTVTEEMEAEQRALAREVEKAKGQVSYYAEELGKLPAKASVFKKLAEPIDSLKEHVQKLKDEHPKLAAAMDKAGEIGHKVASGGFKVLKGAFTAASAAASAVVAGAAAIAKGLVKAADTAADAGDKIDKQSQKVGMSAESYQKWDYVMNISGTSMQNCTTGLKTLTNQFEKAQAGSEGAQDKFKRLGLSMDDLKGKSREEVFETTVKALQGVKSETEKAALANALFGKSGQDLMPLFNQSAEATQELMDKAKEYGMVMSDDAVNASAAYQDSLTSLQTTMKSIKDNAFAELLPGMTSVLDGLTGALTGEDGAEKKIEDGIDSMMKSLDTMIPRFGGVFERVAKVALEAAPKIIVSLADGLISRLDQITESAFKIISTLTEGLLTRENIQTIMTATVSILTNVVGFLADNVDLLVDSAFLMIETLIDGLLAGDNIKKLTHAALDIVVKIATGLIDNLPELLRAAWDLCVALVDAIIHYDWLSVGKNIFNSIKGAIANFFTGGGGGGGSGYDGSHADGLDYVPFDGYRAILHKGERVLTREENEAYKNGGVSVTLSIGEFHNYRQEDINHLADEISEVLAAKMQRKQGAFA